MRYFLLFFICLYTFQAPAQASQQAQVEALNNYTYFTNESVHGLLIVHRLLENFNQKINKYVDLESNQFNFYSNKDLPRNIFEDTDQWFYDVSPYEWYDISVVDSKKLPASLAIALNKDLDQLKAILTRVNAIRFELGHLTESDDLKQRKNLDKIYDKLEECVVLYDNFNVIKEELKLKLKQGYTELKLGSSSSELEIVDGLHENIRAFLAALHTEDEASLPELSTHLGNNIQTATSLLGATPQAKKMLTKTTTFHQSTKKYLQGGSFPEEYQQYGKAYYYYNVELVSKTNRYGSGLVVDMNEWIKTASNMALLQMEEPHFFKVIYPKKQVKVEPVATTPTVGLPSTVKGREVVVRQNHIALNEPTFLLEISDHQLEDGDIISLNFNDRWIIKEYSLKRKALKIQLRLRPNQPNYLLLHAENLGKAPPNTAKIAYIYNGEKQVVVLNSDMGESEMIELKLGE